MDSYENLEVVTKLFKHLKCDENSPGFILGHWHKSISEGFIARGGSFLLCQNKNKEAWLVNNPKYIHTIMQLKFVLKMQICE